MDNIIKGIYIRVREGNKIKGISGDCNCQVCIFVKKYKIKGKQ